MDWNKCGSSGRTPDLQVQIPEFKPHSHQRGEKKWEHPYITADILRDMPSALDH
jgi:hypothetical protein